MLKERMELMPQAAMISRSSRLFLMNEGKTRLFMITRGPETASGE
jgi:hypothetical protein